MSNLFKHKIYNQTMQMTNAKLRKDQSQGNTYSRNHVPVVDDEPAEDLGLGEVLLQVGILLANDPDGQAWTRERVSMDELRR